MSAAEALKAARAAGIQLKIDGDDLLLEASVAPPPDVIDLLSSHKASIVALLRPAEDAWSAEDWKVFVDERAGVIEFDGGAPRRWAEALARLYPASPPSEIPARRWVQFIDDCGRFLDNGWGSRAEALGWGPFDLFGCDRDRPFARIDRAGLLWLINGSKLVALTTETATIETSTGHRQTFQRRPTEIGSIVLAWDLNP
jgi:hypothetical protein